jgi:hypothetical protein
VQAVSQMDGAKFAKLCKDCGLLDKKFTATVSQVPRPRAQVAPTRPARPCSPAAREQASPPGGLQWRLKKACTACLLADTCLTKKDLRKTQTILKAYLTQSLHKGTQLKSAYPIVKATTNQL